MSLDVLTSNSISISLRSNSWSLSPGLRDLIGFIRGKSSIKVSFELMSAYLRAFLLKAIEVAPREPSSMKLSCIVVLTASHVFNSLIVSSESRPLILLREFC